MGEIIILNAVKREPGKLYYIDGEGNLCEAFLQVGGKKKIKEVEVKQENIGEIKCQTK